MSKIKYIKTDRNQIIAFGEAFKHSDFKDWNPVSAGFISIGITTKNGYPEIICECYGDSNSLKLKPDEEDAFLVKQQILGQGMF